MIRRLGWTILLVIASAALLYAAPQMANDKNTTTQTITGCLEKGTEPAGFFLVSTEGKHWELYANSDVSLADQVGKTVAVTGILANRTKEQEKKSQPHERKEIGTRLHADLQVSSLKTVSDTCK